MWTDNHCCQPVNQPYYRTAYADHQQNKSQDLHPPLVQQALAYERQNPPALAGFLLCVVDEIFAEEAVGDFTTKSRPELPGMEAILPMSYVQMSRGVRVGV